ncbi:MAG: DNA polymerase III subunit delta' C-terminal domain-containing protein [Patescibacteria group bacterium]|nr:DNA polymerase III subunit delta' C-terminal domain-containing protein [Patescibacteria group bacterium]
MNWSLIGHKNILKYLENSIESKRLAQAYLFYGPKNVGKNETAMQFVKALLCYEHQKEEGRADLKTVPCGACEFCREVGKKIHPDFFWLAKETGDKNISVEQIREIKDKLSAKSFFKSYKIAIISGAENLSLSAANALLKVLEEPRGRTIIILIAERIDGLPKTIVSRSQKIHFLPVGKKEIYEFLIKEKNVPRESAWPIATLSGGRPGVALSYLKNKDLWQKYLDNLNTFFKLVSAKNHEKIKFAEALLSEKGTLLEQSEALFPLLGFWQTIFRDILLSKLGLSDIIINSKIKSELERLAPYFEADRLVKINRDLENSKLYLRQNANPRLVLENILLNF